MSLVWLHLCHNKVIAFGVCSDESLSNCVRCISKGRKRPIDSEKVEMSCQTFDTVKVIQFFGQVDPFTGSSLLNMLVEKSAVGTPLSRLLQIARTNTGNSSQGLALDNFQ